MIGRPARWVDDQVGLARLARREFLRKIFPDHWSFMLGEVALYSFVVLTLTGIYLTLFFHPSAQPTTYQGAYAPLRGVEMSGAYESVLRISFDVRAGLVVQQVHHWAAVVFVAAIALHLCRVFFTGAFRRPRQLNWIVGVTLLVVAVFSGFTGYSIVDDLLSGTGLVIAYSVLLSVPVAGPWASFLLFGGPVPNPNVIPRLSSMHVMMLPAIIFGLLTLHLVILWRQKHTNYPGPGRSNDSIVGTRLWPAYAAKASGFFFIVFGIIVALGAFVQVNPIWLYGPYNPADVSAGSQPDWYLGWLEGALRLFPSWEPTVFGYLIPNPFFPGALLALFMLVGLYLYPFIEARVTGDRGIHHVLDRPRDRPVRTAIGALAVALFMMLLLAGSDDVLAVIFSADVAALRTLLRELTIGIPILVMILTYVACRYLVKRKGREVATDGTREPEHGA